MRQKAMSTVTGLSSIEPFIPNKNEYTFDEGINTIGYGIYQIKLTLLLGLGIIGHGIMWNITPLLFIYWKNIPPLARSLTPTISYVGEGLSFTILFLSKHVGTKNSIIFIMIISGFATLFSGIYNDSNILYTKYQSISMIFFLFMRFIVGYSVGNSSFIVGLCLEYVPEIKHDLVTLHLSLFWDFGTILICVITIICYALNVSVFYYFLSATLIPFIIIFIAIVKYPNSPRYLLRKAGNEGKHHKIMKRLTYILKEMSIKNRSTMPIGRLQSHCDIIIKIDNKEQTSSVMNNKHSFMSIFSKEFIGLTVFCSLIYIINDSTYFAVLLYQEKFFTSALNINTNDNGLLALIFILIVSFFDLPATLIGLYFVWKDDDLNTRKWLGIMNVLCGILFGILALYQYINNIYAGLVVMSLARFMISVAKDFTDLFILDSFPDDLQVHLLLFCDVLGTLADITLSLITELNSIKTTAIIYSILCFIAVISQLFTKSNYLDIERNQLNPRRKSTNTHNPNTEVALSKVNVLKHLEGLNSCSVTTNDTHNINNDNNELISLNNNNNNRTKSIDSNLLKPLPPTIPNPNIVINEINDMDSDFSPANSMVKNSGFFQYKPA